MGRGGIGGVGGLARAVHSGHANRAAENVRARYKSAADPQEAAARDIQRIARGKKDRRKAELRKEIIRAGVPRAEVSEVKNEADLRALANKHNVEAELRKDIIRAGVPRAEVLAVKNEADLRALANKHNVDPGPKGGGAVTGTTAPSGISSSLC